MKLIMKCLHHGHDLRIQVQAFYNGVHMGARQLIDASAGRSTDTKISKEVYDLIEKIAVK